MNKIIFSSMSIFEEKINDCSIFFSRCRFWRQSLISVEAYDIYKDIDEIREYEEYTEKSFIYITKTNFLVVRTTKIFISWHLRIFTFSTFKIILIKINIILLKSFPEFFCYEISWTKYSWKYKLLDDKHYNLYICCGYQ